MQHVLITDWKTTRCEHINLEFLFILKAITFTQTSKLRSAFTVGTLTTGSSKLDPAWVCFDEIFFVQFSTSFCATA